MCMKKNGKIPGWLCLPPAVIQMAGLVLIGGGVLLIVIFVPLRYWMAALGLVLLLAGVILRVFF